MYNIDNG